MSVTRSQLQLLRSSPARLIALLILAVVPHAANAHAQADATAYRAIGLSAFAGAQGVHPEFGGSPDIYGFLIGGDITHYFRIASPSLEVRYNHATGSTVSQNSFLLGFKAEHAYGAEQRFHPYLTGLIGLGTINFSDPDDPGYNHDNSMVLDLGAGLDFDVTRAFAIKGDLHIQHWQLGKESPVFSPEIVSVALVYRPFFRKGLR
jgi:opacity protein-like surface antigen